MTRDVIQVVRKQRPIIAIIGGAGPDAAIDLQVKLSRAMKKKLNYIEAKLESVSL